MEYGAKDLTGERVRFAWCGDAMVRSSPVIGHDTNRLPLVFGGRPLMRILVEASTESEWVAQDPEDLGHEVIVADPTYAPMYGHRSRRIKTDRRDVAALTEACHHGTYRMAHRRSARQHIVQCQLNVRAELTQARTRAISLVRAITRAAGFRIRSGRTETFLVRLAALELTDSMKATLFAAAKRRRDPRRRARWRRRAVRSDGGRRSHAQAAHDVAEYRPDYRQCLCGRAGYGQSF